MRGRGNYVDHEEGLLLFMRCDVSLSCAFEEFEVSRGMFRCSSVATKSIAFAVAFADIIQNNAACLTKCLATSYVG
jgi:hypothetical protein